MRRLATIFAAVGALAAPASASAHHWAPGACGLPAALPLSVEYAEVAVSPVIRAEIFGASRPPLVLASSGKAVPPELRAAGAHTVFWEMNLRRIAGTTRVLVPPDTIDGAADRLYARAVESTGCATPLIAINELEGNWVPTPWSYTNGQYRANVLQLLRRLHERGAHAYLLVAATRSPYTASVEAAQWWAETARVADIVLQLHFDGRYINEHGALLGSRLRRQKMRRALSQFTELGVPPERLGLLHGFQSGRGAGGREGLPLADWLRIVKWEVLATRQVLAERAAAGAQIGSDWSWGWGDFPALSRIDPDKHVTACVFLWARDQTACDGPGRAAANGVAFNSSLHEGQILLPPDIHCAVASPPDGIPTAVVGRLARLRGADGVVGRKAALAALFERVVERRRAHVAPTDVVAAEEAIVTSRFGGDRAAYDAAVAASGGDPELARHVIAEQLRQRKLVARFRGYERFRAWTLAAQRRALARTTCVGDELPTPARVDLERVLPFLALAN